MSEEIKQYLDPGKKNLILIYVLYLCGILVPIFPIVGAIFAFANQNNANDLWRSHYVFAFRTFIVAVAGAFLAMITTLIFIGPVLGVLVVVWVAVRSIVALQFLLEGVPHPNPLTFWIK